MPEKVGTVAFLHSGLSKIMASSPNQPRLQKLQLLLVDADPANLALTAKTLRLHDPGCSVDAAPRAEECLRKISEKTYDLILLAYDLPDINGLTLLETFRGRGLSQPVVVVLDAAEEELAQRVLEAGALDYLVKTRGYLSALPYAVRQLVARFRLDRRTAEPRAATERGEARRRLGYFLLDRRGRFLSANADVEALTAYKEEELLELTLTDLMPREHEWEFFQWLRTADERGEAEGFAVVLRGKYGQAPRVQVSLTAQKDASQEITGYRGEFREIEALPRRELARDGQIDQIELIDELLGAVSSSLEEPLNVLLSRVTEISCQRFYFKRASLALFDRHRRAYIKQAIAGYPYEHWRVRQTLEVPEEVISRIFSDRFKIKVIYYHQNGRDDGDRLGTMMPERRTQRRRAPSQWHQRDLVLVNLTNAQDRSFGYISLEEPLEGHIPVRETFHNLEIFGRLASQFIQQYFHFAAQERRTRRLKQMLVTSNIFKLQLSLGELLREVVWSVKFSLDFNLVMLGLISRRSGMLEIKAVASDDKIKAMQTLDFGMSLRDCAALLKNEYRSGKSYFIDREEPALRALKQIYHRPLSSPRAAENWPWYALLMMPLKSHLGKIIGFLMVDQPADAERPAPETIRLLELLANQISVAMDNRVLYLAARRDTPSPLPATPEGDLGNPAGHSLRRFIDALLH